MSTELHSFIDIFNSTFETDAEPVKLEKIVIPIIQRDYAQGRADADIQRVRNRFLESLHHAVTIEPITLDFVYGDIDEHGVMTPLDGQQRLTTLFLLHWYAAKRESIAESECDCLSRFSYETRYSARDFCSLLLSFVPTFDQQISKEIVDQAWFPLDWLKDPTISSMLVMLDAISEVFADVPNLWQRLRSGAITFYFLPIREMGLTDELYIKMNSRGKPLTSFEHFKAELEHELRMVDEAAAKTIAKKIDLDWTEMLWPYRGNDNVIDDEFLRYFRYVCDVICYHNGGTPQGKYYDEFNLIKVYFSADAEHPLENARTLENYFDCWCSLGESPAEFLSRFISHSHEPGKIKIDSRNSLNIFEDCLRSYSDRTGRQRDFPLNRIALLYAVTSYLQRRDILTEEQFSRRLRIINNLIQNSEDEISDSEARTSGNRMPAILAQVDHIMETGMCDDSLTPNFAPAQLAEETEKTQWLAQNPDKAEALFSLEDHILLRGQIGIIGLENYELFPRFDELFQCSLDKIDCALMTIGFYGQQERNRWRYQLGSSNMLTAWSNLFHKSGNVGFEDTKRVLVELLSISESFDDEMLDGIITGYIFNCIVRREFEWRYYYVKYSSFRPGRYGKYCDISPEDNHYVFTVMATSSKLSENAYVPYLKEADPDHLSKDDYGTKLVYSNCSVKCENNAYIIKDRGTGQEIDRINIAQNEKGIDTEDRIELLRVSLNQSEIISKK